MKHYNILNILFILGFLLVIQSTVSGQGIGINNDNSAADPTAMLNIKATDKGLLISGVALTGISDVTTIPNPATGLMVFNTSQVNDMTRSFYFWNGFFWDHVEGPDQWVSNIYGIYNLSDNVGIGVTNPLQKLHVNRSTYISGFLGLGESNPQCMENTNRPGRL